MKTRTAVLRRLSLAAILTGLVLTLPACDFERDRAFAPAGLLGFLAQISRPGEIVIGQYCGQTAAFTGNAGGYTNIKNLCVSACGSTTAHLCQSRELMLGVENGVTPPSNSWYGSFVFSIDVGAGTTDHDCQGWTTNAVTSAGPIYGTAPVAPTRDFCNVAYPFACCDYVVLAQ